MAAPPSLRDVWLVFARLECSALESLNNCCCFSFSSQSKIASSEKSLLTTHNAVCLCHVSLVVCLSSLHLSPPDVTTLLTTYLFTCSFSALATCSQKRDAVVLAHYCLPSAKNHVWQTGREQYILMKE